MDAAIFCKCPADPGNQVPLRRPSLTPSRSSPFSPARLADLAVIRVDHRQYSRAGAPTTRPPRVNLRPCGRRAALVPGSARLSDLRAPRRQPRGAAERSIRPAPGRAARAAASPSRRRRYPSTFAAGCAPHRAGPFARSPARMRDATNRGQMHRWLLTRAMRRLRMDGVARTCLVGRSAKDAFTSWSRSTRSGAAWAEEEGRCSDSRSSPCRRLAARSRSAWRGWPHLFRRWAEAYPSRALHRDGIPEPGTGTEAARSGMATTAWLPGSATTAQSRRCRARTALRF
jgi:hypothetical protein